MKGIMLSLCFLMAVSSGFTRWAQKSTGEPYGGMDKPAKRIEGFTAIEEGLPDKGSSHIDAGISVPGSLDIDPGISVPGNPDIDPGMLIPNSGGTAPENG